MCLILKKQPEFTYKPSESHIILAAYYLWLKANQPQGDGIEFYYQAQKECNYQILYKIVRLEDGKWTSPCVRYQWELGWNTSTWELVFNENLKQAHPSQIVEVNHGFHFFNNYEDAQFAAKKLGCKVIAAHCYKEHFVAQGVVSSNTWAYNDKLVWIKQDANSPQGPPSAVFSKCYVPKLPHVDKSPV